MNDAFHLRTYHGERVKAYPWFWRRVLRWLQRKCRHRAMKADITNVEVGR